MNIRPDIEITEDGSATLRHPVTGDTYHSVRGALGEALYVFIENGLKQAGGKHIRILEIGFGSGLNAWLTLDYAAGKGISVDYTALELYPVDTEVVAETGYTDNELFMRLHEVPWNTKQDITPDFSITKIEGDLAGSEFDATFDLIYFDAFAPDTQPELWTTEIFSRLYGTLSDGGILVTYSAKGSVKRALREAGFEVTRLKGALGKRHMLRATKTGVGK